jgi:hypothetical protein
MAAIKPIDQVAAKWARVTPQRSEDYKMGVQNPRTPWAAAAQAAQERYKQAVTEAANQGRYAKGVSAAGDQKWQSKSVAKGPGRFAEGVAVSAPDYQEGFAPYAQTIAATQLPPRFAAGDPRNLERVRVISQALRKRKVGG